MDANAAKFRRRRREAPVAKWAIAVAVGLFVLAVYVFLYAPMIITALFSFNDSKVQTLPFSGFTFRWYEDLFADQAMKDAIVYSLKVALVSVGISACVALGFSLMLHKLAIRGKAVIQALLASPLVAPGLVLGISLLVIFNSADIQPGFWTIVAGHCSFITPLIMFILLQRLKTQDPSLEQASMDCGAGHLRTFWHVTLPSVRVALVAGCLLGFTLSMDEIAVTFFLAGTDPTLPVYVWGLLRFGFTPEVNAAFTLIAGGSLLLIATAGLLLFFSGRRHRLPEEKAAGKRRRLNRSRAGGTLTGADLETAPNSTVQET
jgi:ABC-type spermidine/putrescine transport system permease subunit II